MNLSLPSSPTISSATASSNNPPTSTSWFYGIVRGRIDRSGSVKMFSSFSAGELAVPIKGQNQFRGMLFKYGSKAVQVAFKTGDYKQQVIFIGGLIDGFLATEYLEPLDIALDKEKWSLVQVLLSSSYTGYGTSNLQQVSYTVPV